MIKFIQGVVVSLLLLGCVEEDKTVEDADVKEDAGEDAGQDAGKTKQDTEEVFDDPRIDQETMANEIVTVWNTIFNDAEASKDDYRRALFPGYADMIARHIRLFQDTRIDENILGGRLPVSTLTHQLIAVMIYRESSVMPEVVGRSHGEVGFLQLHGAALQGYSRKEVQNNPELGVILGLRWLSRAVRVCHPDGLSDWSFDNWLGPLAVYGGGEQRAMTNGKCHTDWAFAKERVNTTKNYAIRLLANKE